VYRSSTGTLCSVKVSSRFPMVSSLSSKRQGLTLVHFPAQLKRFLWDSGCL
jgi:hypothetical protein